MQELVERAQRGDLKAFGQLVERFQDAVHEHAHVGFSTFGAAPAPGRCLDADRAGATIAGVSSMVLQLARNAMKGFGR